MPSRVLLSSIMTPIGPRQGDGKAVGYELLHGQVTRSQGVFSPRAVHTQYGIDYIAANLDTPTVALHYPSERDFVAELRSGSYSHVGIAFNLSTSHRMRKMCRLVRRHAPSATIVLGGYGTLIPAEELLEHGDVICRGEGVSSMRALLGEPEIERPYDHPLVVSTLKLLGVPVAKTGLIFGGLGCPNGCDFCCTSHYYDRRHISLLPTGDDLFEVIRAYRELVPGIEFTMLDEDFLLNRDRAMQLRARLLRERMPLDMFVFASVKALSQYTAQELLEIGVGGVWLGFEGSRSGYDKREGRDVAELFVDLKRHGIQILSSMILGLDYQTPEIIRDEFEQLISLGPTYTQFLIYGPNPGTPLGKRIDLEGRWREPLGADRHLRYRHSDGFTCTIQHPHMSPEQIEDLQQWCYEEDYRRQGPSILRTAEVWQTGRAYLTGRSEPILRARRAYLEKRLPQVGPLLPLFRTLAPSQGVRQRVDTLAATIRQVSSMRDRMVHGALGAITLPAAALTSALLKLDAFQHPRLIRHDWSGEDRPPVARFQPRARGRLRVPA